MVVWAQGPAGQDPVRAGNSSREQLSMTQTGHSPVSNATSQPPAVGRRSQHRRSRSDPLDGPMGNEPGFRGLAQPHLQRTFTPLGATLPVAVVATGWHLPLLAQRDMVPVDLLSTVAVTFWYAWLFNGSGGSVLISWSRMRPKASWSTTTSGVLVRRPTGSPTFTQSPRGWPSCWSCWTGGVGARRGQSPHPKWAALDM